ncbi:MAG: flagellar basal-body rod protein FlgF [Candidatus Aenigmarchaeota archaeon]|nr:flagellar basal-body rod protein FlgF [Candidatus Aenigmarchaeota archaeon]
MYKGIYIALSGALLKQKHMDTFANNVANANTTGFKKERVSFKDYMIPVDNKVSSVDDGRVMSEMSNIMTDFSHGGISQTGNPLDLAINGEGFFALEGNLYTRNGSFKVSSDGYLATNDDVKVLGDGGPISIDGNKIEIGDSGDILVDGVSVGKLSIVNFENKNVLLKQNGSVFTTDVQGVAGDSKVSQGYIEASNVEVVREMVQMLNTVREFESYQKMIKAFDEAASKTINEMGK